MSGWSQCLSQISLTSLSFSDIFVFSYFKKALQVILSTHDLVQYYNITKSSYNESWVGDGGRVSYIKAEERSSVEADHFHVAPAEPPRGLTPHNRQLEFPT